MKSVVVTLGRVPSFDSQGSAKYLLAGKQDDDHDLATRFLFILSKLVLKLVAWQFISMTIRMSMPIGPDGFACTTRGGVCNALLPTFGPGGLRAPCVLACAMRSLAIVITIVQSFSPLFFLSVFCFWPTSGNSHVRNNFLSFFFFLISYQPSVQPNLGLIDYVCMYYGYMDYAVAACRNWAELCTV